MRRTLRQWRRDRDITQVEMAKAIGVSVPTYQTYEKCPGVIRLETLFRICAVLNIGINDIQYWTDSSGRMLFTELKGED